MGAHRLHTASPPCPRALHTRSVTLGINLGSNNLQGATDFLTFLLPQFDAILPKNFLGSRAFRSVESFTAFPDTVASEVGSPSFSLAECFSAQTTSAFVSPDVLHIQVSN